MDFYIQQWTYNHAKATNEILKDSLLQAEVEI